MKEIDIYIKRAEVEKAYKFREWIDEIPYLNLPVDWQIKIIPPFAGAMARFYIKINHPHGFLSVYLDCYDELGYVGEPYWEVHPDEGGGCFRCLMNETDELLAKLKKLKDFWDSKHDNDSK